MSMDKEKYREIVTKAVCGKGRKFSQSAHTLTPPHRPSRILGCWIINHKFKTFKDGDGVVVEGCYDINVWYSFSNNTKTEVITETVTYKEVVPLSVRDEHCGHFEKVNVQLLQEPNCLETNISPNGNKIVVQVEQEVAVEVLGETKICVRVDPNGCVSEVEDKDNKDDYHIEEEEFKDLDPYFLSDDEKD